MIYLLDTNVISDLLIKHAQITQQIEQHKINNDQLIVCQPVFYELMRGLIRTRSTKKLSILRDQILPSFDWQNLEADDWLQAAQYWSFAISIGKQLSDMDFLIAALATRLNATLVSSDTDFDALPIKREDWRVPTS